MKTKALILTILSLCLIIGFCGCSNNNTESYTLENAYNDYINADNDVIATVNNYNITNKDICLIKYSYNTSKPLEQAIKQRTTVFVAENDNFALSQEDKDKEINYINERYKTLKLISSNENDEFYNALVREHLETTISIKYQYNIVKQILNQNFECDNDSINKKYEKYKKLYKKWEDGGKKNALQYKKLWSLREKIAEDYIEYKTAQFQVIIYD